MKYNCVTHGWIDEHEVDEEGFCTHCHDVVVSQQEEIVDWLETLLSYAKGEKKWDTGGVWVCECHRFMPFTKDDHTFGCECGGPGMAPYTPETIS